MWMEDHPIQLLEKLRQKRLMKKRIEELKTPRLKELLYELHCIVEAEKVTLDDVRPGLR